MMNNTINGRTPEEIKRGLECCKPVWVDNHWKTCDTKCPYIDDVGGFCRAQLMADALALVQQLESAQPKWISVADELPKKWRENDAEQTLVNYQIYSPKYGVDIGNYLKPAGIWVIMGLPVDDVTHWMPLPSAPEVK